MILLSVRIFVTFGGTVQPLATAESVEQAIVVRKALAFCHGARTQSYHS